MSYAFNLRLGFLLLAAAVGSGAGISCTGLAGIHDGCVTTADCDPGRRCVAGTCQPGTNQDASVDGVGDTDREESADRVDIAQEQTSNIDANVGDEASDRAHGYDAGDANDAHDARDADEPHDASDARDASDGRDAYDAPDTGDGVDSRPDTSGDGKKEAPSPCFLPTDAAAAPANAALPQNLSGTWRLCTDVANLAPDVHWMLGDTATIQLDGVNWWRLANGQVDHGDAAFAGTYFRLLEGTPSVFEFVDADVNAGGGSTLAVGLFPAEGVLELTSCDGAGICDALVARLVKVAGASGQ